MDIPEENGSRLSVDDEKNATLEIGSSLSLPINVIDMEKVVAVESIEWDNRLSKRQQKSSDSIYLMGPNHHKGPNVDEVTPIKCDNRLSKGQRRSPPSVSSRGPNLHKEPNVDQVNAIERDNQLIKGQQRSPTSISSRGPSLLKEPNVDQVTGVAIEWDNRLIKGQQRSPASISLGGPNLHKEPNVGQVTTIERDSQLGWGQQRYPASNSSRGPKLHTQPNVDQVTPIEWYNRLTKGQPRSPTSISSRDPSLHKEPNVDQVTATEFDNRLSKGQPRSPTSISSRGPNLHKGPNVDLLAAVELDNQLSKEQQSSATSISSQGPNLHEEPNVDQIPVKSLNVNYGCQPTSPDKSIMPLQDQSSFNHEIDIVIPAINNDDKELEEVCRLGEKINEIETRLIYAADAKAIIEQEMRDKLQPYGLGSMDSLLTKEEITTTIQSMENTAASVLCNPSTQEKQLNSFMKDIVGVVALVGSVQSLQLSRMLAEYLGEDKMLGVIIKSLDTASSLERYKQNGEVDFMSTLHAEAAALGKGISKRFHVICFEDIRPYHVDFEKNDPQRKLALPDPKLPNGKIPAGFKGYAVNMVDLDINHLQMKTASGHGLRETVLFSLFKNLHVYQTRASMVAARACIVDGAVSLDGGIIRENGILSLGYGNPSVYFPCLNMMEDLSPEAKEILKEKEEMKTSLRKIEETISELTKYLEKYRKKFEKKKERYNKIMDKILEHKPKVLEYNPETEKGQI